MRKAIDQGLVYSTISFRDYDFQEVFLTHFRGACEKCREGLECKDHRFIKQHYLNVHDNKGDTLAAREGGAKLAGAKAARYNLKTFQGSNYNSIDGQVINPREPGQNKDTKRGLLRIANDKIDFGPLRTNNTALLKEQKD